VKEPVKKRKDLQKNSLLKRERERERGREFLVTTRP
jgi:hypothetical protein